MSRSLVPSTIYGVASDNEDLRRCHTDDQSVLNSMRCRVQTNQRARIRSRDPLWTLVADACVDAGKKVDPAMTPSACNGSLDCTQTVLDTLVCCIEELQAHVSFLFTQVRQPEVSRDIVMPQAKSSLWSAHHKAYRGKTQSLRRHMWEIKRLKASVRALCSRQRRAARNIRHVAAKCSNRHRVSVRTKGFPYSRQSYEHMQVQQMSRSARALSRSGESCISLFATRMDAPKGDPDGMRAGTEVYNGCCKKKASASPHRANTDPVVISLNDVSAAAALQRLSWMKPQEDRLQAALEVAGSLPVDDARGSMHAVTPAAASVTERSGVLQGLDLGHESQLQREELFALEVDGLPRMTDTENQAHHPDLGDEAPELDSLALGIEGDHLARHFDLNVASGQQSEPGEVPRERAESRERNKVTRSMMMRWSAFHNRGVRIGSSASSVVDVRAI